MRIFVFEFFSGGGNASKDVSNSLLSEGYAMLRSVLSDFNKTKHEIISTLDYRIKKFNPPIYADEIFEISRNINFNNKFNEILSQNIDAVFLIAPETDNILYNLAKKVEELKIPLLGPNTSSIKITTDKYQTIQHIGHDAAIPKTIKISIDTSLDEITKASENVGFPFVMKPLDGVACAGISLIQKKEEIQKGVKIIQTESKEKEFIIQEYIKGIDSSLSLLIGDNKVIPLTLNYQNIKLQSPESASQYQGGYTPFDHPIKQEIIEHAKKIIENIKGLKGYIGIDYVLTPEKVYFMEINPRLTTSYVGIRAVTKQNIPKEIIDLIIYKNEEIAPFNFQGYSFFSKIDLFVPKLTLPQFQTKYFKENIVAPPFVIKGKEKETATAFIYSFDNNFSRSKKQFEKIKIDLLIDG